MSQPAPGDAMLTVLTALSGSLPHHGFTTVSLHAGGRITLISQWRAEQFESVDAFVKWLERGSEADARADKEQEHARAHAAAH